MVRLRYAISGALLAASSGLASGQPPLAISPKSTMTAAGLPLPLKGEETFVPLGNVCGYISPIAAPPRPSATEDKMKWRGACRFGLVDGHGFADMSPKYRSLYEWTYRLGILQPGVRVSHHGYGGKWTEYRSESYLAFNRPEAIYISNWSLPANAGANPRYLHFRHSTGGTDVWSRYNQGALSCPYPLGTPISPEKLQPFSEADRKLVIRRCRDSYGALDYIEYKRVEEPSYEANFPDGQREHILSRRYYLCRSDSDCREAWTAATAAEWPKIERLKVELTAAHKAFMIEWEARFAPLEAAFQAKLKRLSAPARAGKTK